MSRLSGLWDALGLRSCSVVDIGARGDENERWRTLGERLSLTCFEPDPEEFRRLQASGKKMLCLPYALSDRTQTVAFHSCRSPYTSSCLKPNTALLKRFPEPDRFDILREGQLETRTLDEALQGQGPVDFVKIDAQGFELKIIAGGQRRLSEAFGAEVEVEFLEMYEGQPLFADIDQAMRKLGFVLFDLMPCYWKRSARPCRGAGQLSFADALYLKDPVASGVLPNNPAAALAICALYERFDYAVELARFFKAPGAESALLGLSTPLAPWGRMKGARRLVDAMQALSDRLQETDWSRYESWRF